MSSASTSPIAPAPLPDWAAGSRPPLQREPKRPELFDLLLKPEYPQPISAVPLPPSEATHPKPHDKASSNDAAPPPSSPTNGDGPADSSIQHQADGTSTEETNDADGKPIENHAEAPSDENPLTDESEESEAVIQSLVGACAVAAVPIVDAGPLEGDEIKPEAGTSEPEIALPAIPSAETAVTANLGTDGSVSLTPSGNESPDQQAIVPLPAVQAVAAIVEAKSGDACEISVNATDPKEANTQPGIDLAEPALSDDGAESDGEPESGKPSSDARENVTPVVSGESVTVAEMVQAAALPDANQPTQSESIQGPQSSTTASAPIVSAADPPRVRLPPEIVTAHLPPGRATEADIARFLNRVSRAFAVAAERGGEVTLRLSPPELGSLRLEVQVHEGAMVARVEAESMDAQAAILDNLSALRERLADQGVRIERFDVDLMNRQPGGEPQRSFDEQREAPRTSQQRAPTAGQEEARSPKPVLPLAPQPGRLNVIV